jgi:hypothetical protein
MTSSPAIFANSDAAVESAPAGDLVICGSMSALGTMHRIARALLGHGLPAVLPDTDDAARWDHASPQKLRSLKRAAGLAHLKRVKARRTASVLAVNVDRHGVEDYIGPNTFAELALGFAHGKRLYVWQDIPAQFADELCAWGVVSLDGRLDRLIHAELLPVVRPDQLSLFDDWHALRWPELSPLAA